MPDMSILILMQNVILYIMKYWLHKSISIVFSLEVSCLVGVLHVRPTRGFIIHMKAVPIPVKGCKLINLYMALMVIEQWDFNRVPHLLWHGATVYNSNLLQPVTIIPVGERSAVELSLRVFSTYVCRVWDSNTQPSTCGTTAALLFETRELKNWIIYLSKMILFSVRMNRERERERERERKRERERERREREMNLYLFPVFALNMMI